ncbi:hypothetical protein ACIPZG_06025 [Pseudomonas sp. NPDC089395]|uniref:hypothetical protein n=1 Tax=unclassified Pseudomonas TaxID=196821 RepID=UPI00381118EC
MFGSLYDPRFPIPEMKTAEKYIKQLSWVGSNLLALCWLLATVNVSTSVLLGTGVCAGLYLAYVGTDYRRAFPRIRASITNGGLLRLFLKAWPAFVAIVIISGLAVEAFTWQQLGQIKTQILGLAAIHYGSWILGQFLTID